MLRHHCTWSAHATLSCSYRLSASALRHLGVLVRRHPAKVMMAPTLGLKELSLLQEKLKQDASRVQRLVSNPEELSRVLAAAEASCGEDVDKAQCKAKALEILHFCMRYMCLAVCLPHARACRALFLKVLGEPVCLPTWPTNCATCMPGLRAAPAWRAVKPCCTTACTSLRRGCCSARSPAAPGHRPPPRPTSTPGRASRLLAAVPLGGPSRPLAAVQPQRASRAATWGAAGQFH
jgi:hypothetical protein